MKNFRFLVAGFLFLFLLSACKDTSGLSPESSRRPKGNPGAGVVMQEYFDFQCPFCAQAHFTVATKLLEEYKSVISYEVKHFPLASHPMSLITAQASECAADQGKFWEYTEKALENQNEINEINLYRWAEELILDKDLFKRCLESDIKKDTVLADYEEGKKRGVKGTPSYFVNGEKIEPTQSLYQDLKQAIEKNLEKLNTVPL